MHFLIEKLFKKRGIKDVRELEPEEKETFDRWNGILSKEDVKVSDIKKFCQEQLKKLEVQFSDPDNSPQKDTNLKACLAVYTAILGAIEGPQVEREALEKHLEDLIK